MSERLKVDLGIHYIVHKLTKLELSQMSGNNNDNSSNNININNNSNNNDEMKKDDGFSNQVKYFVIKVHSNLCFLCTVKNVKSFVIFRSFGNEFV